ncbi:MAG: hypothetical protein RLZZ444_499, partial [Pseudomonadota bacterium]
MALNVVHYKHEDIPQWGVLKNSQITPIPGYFPTTGAFLASHNVETLRSLQGETIAEASVELLSPVTENQQFLCQGANYRQHMIES